MKDYYKHIALKYGTDMCQCMKTYSNLVEKLTKLKHKQQFLNTCRSYGLVPAHITTSTVHAKKLFKNSNCIAQYEKFEQTFHKKILNLEISESYTSTKKILKEK